MINKLNRKNSKTKFRNYRLRLLGSRIKSDKKIFRQIKTNKKQHNYKPKLSHLTRTYHKTKKKSKSQIFY